MIRNAIAAALGRSFVTDAAYRAGFGGDRVAGGERVRW